MRMPAQETYSWRVREVLDAWRGSPIAGNSERMRPRRRSEPLHQGLVTNLPNPMTAFERR